MLLATRWAPWTSHKSQVTYGNEKHRILRLNKQVIFFRYDRILLQDRKVAKTYSLLEAAISNESYAITRYYEIVLG